jgi:hypothetical protein
VIRPPAIALAGVLAASLAALPAPAAAQAAPDPGDPAARRAEVTALNREVANISGRIAELETKAGALADYEATLAKRVDKLKRESPGVMRDAQLRDALKELRRVLASQRNLENVRRILNTTLRTRQVALVEKADAEADRLLARGEALVRAGKDDDASARFGAAIDLLMLGNSAKPREDARRRAVPEPTGQLSLNGHETPDEMREMGLLLRDGADKFRWNAAVRADELDRLQVERKNLKALLDLVPAPSEAATRALAELSARIGWVSGEIDRLHRNQGMFLVRAALVEREADLEERSMMAEVTARHQEAAP